MVEAADPGTNGWAPSSVMILHGSGVRTSVRFNPLEPQRQAPAAKWRVRARVYGKHPLHPIWEEEGPVIGWGEQYELRSDELARQLGVDELRHYAEFHPYSLDVAPTHEQIVAPLFAHYSSEDGSFAAHLPSSYIYGSARAYKIGGSMKYQNFPCLEVGGEFEVEIYSVNPFLRKATYWVQLVGQGGEVREYGPFSMRPKSFHVWRSERAGLGDGPAPAGLVVKSDIRITSFVGTYNRALGRMVGLDHTHPFFPQ